MACTCFCSMVQVFFFNATPTTEIYTLSLHDALPISVSQNRGHDLSSGNREAGRVSRLPLRSEEHTSELQSRLHLVCRLLLEKKKTFYRATPARLRSPAFRGVLPGSVPDAYRVISSAC